MGFKDVLVNYLKDPYGINRFSGKDKGDDDGTRIASQDSPAGYLRRESIRKKFDQTNPQGFLEMPVRVSRVGRTWLEL